MQEPEVSLLIAMAYIRDGKTHSDVTVSIDGAHVGAKGTVRFDVIGFMREHGYRKCGVEDGRWQGTYENPAFSTRILISSEPGKGDVKILLEDGNVLYIESKKIRGGKGGEYPAMREAIGQLMTGCPNDTNMIPVVAVPHTVKSAELAKEWSQKTRIRMAGIRFMLVREDGEITFAEEAER